MIRDIETLQEDLRLLRVSLDKMNKLKSDTITVSRRNIRVLIEITQQAILQHPEYKGETVE